ncbi:hypothetical protein [Deinococcus sp. NW-56]|uniref:hypothetical protein n=1 Tax=Deinococcus sp. NW-56 TaxID=2080419 RepID=UPI000CF4C1EC|nr:hypothetical protein [Deinococcus sp. NW-56]
MPETLSLPDAPAIRRTDDGRISVFDALQVVGAKNPRDMWKRLVDAFPEVVEICDNLRFPGAGQRLTPVTDEAGWRRIVSVLPGMLGRKYRAEANALVDRYLAGDATLAAELIDRQTDPEQARWLARRAQHKHSSILLNGSLARHGASKRGYRYVHNRLNLSVTGMVAQEIQLTRGNPTTKDNFTEQELAIHTTMQFAVINELDATAALGDMDCKGVADQVSSDFSPVLRRYFGRRAYPQGGLLQVDV